MIRRRCPPGVLHSATEEANWLFRKARIQIQWESPSSEPPEDQGTDMTSPSFQRPDTRRYIVVRFISVAPTSILPGVLGYALPLAHKGAHVLIFYDRVETLAHIYHEATSIILGHAIAHEIGHVLLRSCEHATGGLMEERWTPATWSLAFQGRLAFGHEELERMRAALQRFQAPQFLPVQQTTLASSGPAEHRHIR